MYRAELQLDLTLDDHGATALASGWGMWRVPLWYGVGVRQNATERDDLRKGRRALDYLKTRASAANRARARGFITPVRSQVRILYRPLDACARVTA